MHLSNSKNLHTLIWTEPPNNYQVIQRLKNLDTKQKQPEMNKGYPIFEWILGIPITNQADDGHQTEDDEIA